MPRPPTHLALVSGAGGGGKGGGGGSTHVPTEAPDSLRSRAYARVLDLVCEGEIEGLVDGLKSVYLDETPVQNADGTMNFGGVTLYSRAGTQSQAYVPGFGAAESEVAVGVEVKQSQSVTRQVTNTNATAVRVTVGVPRLTFQDPTNGDLRGTSVQIAIDLQSAGGGFNQVRADTISGKTTTRYQRSYRIELTGSPPWDVRVRRLTSDSSQANLLNATWWDSMTELIETLFTYPNSAIVALQVSAQQFRSIPRRGYDMKLLRVRVPSNYDPATRAYSGVWDGTFTVDWTDNPAWCWYDMVTSPRYGLGEFIDDALVDKWTLYAIAQYCDELVPDGFGGTEPRFTCNLYLQQRAEAYNVVQALASIFRGMAWWQAGILTTSQDAPADPAYLFTPANVVGGEFRYQGSARKARHTVAMVAWNDPDDLYRQRIEYVEDRAGIERYGAVQTEIVAVGCTSRGQAHRAGKWALFSERLETETVTFRAGLEGTQIAPGMVFQIQDPFRAGKRFGGRIRAASDSQVTLDAQVTLESGKTYQLSVVLPDASVEISDVTTAPGDAGVIDVAPSYSQAPAPESVWVLTASDLAPTTWRAIGVGEVDGVEQEITALAHYPGKYDLVEQDISLEPVPTTTLKPAVQEPADNLVLSEYLYIAKGDVKTMLTLAWDPAPGAAYYVPEYRSQDGNWVTLPSIGATHAEAPDVLPGIYEIRVTAVSPLGVPSPAVTASGTVLGKTAPPPDIDELLVQRQADGTRQFSWIVSAPPLDLAGTQLRYKLGTGHAWEDMAPLHSGLLTASPYETNLLAAGTYTVGAKLVDTSGNESAHAQLVQSTLGDPRIGSAALDLSLRQEAWPGTLTDCHIEPETGDVVADGTDTWAGLPSTWAAWGSWVQSVVTSFSFEPDEIDLGADVTFTPLTTVTTRDGNPTIEYQHRTAGGAYQGAWQTVSGSITARYVLIRVTVATTGVDSRIIDGRFVASADVIEELIEDLDTSAIGNGTSGDRRLPLAKSYSVISRVGVALQNTGPGWSWEIVDKDAAQGPRIRIYDATDTLSDAVIDAEIRGLA